MRLSKIKSIGEEVPVEAVLIEKNNHSYYNIFHGDPHCWEFRCSVDKRMSNKRENTLPLNKDNYILRELRDNNKLLLKDPKGNVYYVISKDNDPTHKNDLLLFIDLDVELTDVIITYTGFARSIGNGYRGKTTTPCPVVEFYGDGEVCIKGKINATDEYIRIFKYHHTIRKLKRI